MMAVNILLKIMAAQNQLAVNWHLMLYSPSFSVQQAWDGGMTAPDAFSFKLCTNG